MKILSFILLISASQLVQAQDFSMHSESSPFDGVQGGSVAFVDVDGDNDQDLFLTGRTSTFQYIARLYLNDGQGDFSLVQGTPFKGVLDGSVAFADVDGDNDQDLLITGSHNFRGFSQLYINDGSGNFTEASGNSFPEVEESAIAFSDVDNDGDQDVFIIGEERPDEISQLFLNDGAGQFSLDTVNSFIDVKLGAVNFSDVDGDNDKDLLLVGSIGFFSNHTAKLYKNDGQGHFSEATGSYMHGVYDGDAAFTDIDGDNDHDILVSGYNYTLYEITTFYKNDGSGEFTEIFSPNNLVEIENGSISIADVDLDGDEDVLMTGRDVFSNPVANLYLNDGQGNYTIVGGTPFTPVSQSSSTFADVDGDNDKDLLITGADSSQNYITELYINNGSGRFLTSDNTYAAASNTVFKIFPNPVGDEKLSVEYRAKETCILQLKLMDASGRIVWGDERSLKKGNRVIHCSIPEDLKGMYFMEIKQGSRITTSKVVVE